MLKDAIQYLVSLKDNQTYEFFGDIYSDRELHRVEPHIDHPGTLSLYGLDSAVQMVRNELDMLTNLPLFIQVGGPDEVVVFSTFGEAMTRDFLYSVKSDVPVFSPGFREYERAVIELRSRFVPSEGTEYMLSLLSSISKDSNVTSSDNGVSQTVEARQGISLKAKVKIEPRVKLRPYRTFLEVEQPESEFLLRLDGQGNVGLFEADGGMWMMDAKKNIRDYFEKALAQEIAQGKVVVMM